MFNGVLLLSMSSTLDLSFCVSDQQSVRVSSSTHKNNLLFFLSPQTDRQPAHRLQTLVNQTLHYISHIYHAVSDCMMDLHTTPPRVLRAPAGMMVAPIRPAGQMPVHVSRV